jgi:hypothetical protein
MGIVAENNQATNATNTVISQSKTIPNEAAEPFGGSLTLFVCDQVTNAMDTLISLAGASCRT